MGRDTLQAQQVKVMHFNQNEIPLGTESDVQIAAARHK
jgi:hypothetical protein